MSTLAEQVVEQLKTDMDNVYDAGYQKGLKEVGGLDVSKFGIQNEVTGKGLVTLDYVNENEHNVEVKLSSDTVTDFSGVEVKCIGKNFFDLNYALDKNNYTIDTYLNQNLPIYVGAGNNVTFSWKIQEHDGTTNSNICIKDNVDGNNINLSVHKEMGVEVVGDTKVRISVLLTKYVCLFLCI